VENSQSSKIRFLEEIGFLFHNCLAVLVVEWRVRG
jgi:hypothetical protein